MKSFDRSDLRIAKSILNKADKITPKLSDLTTRIEQIEEEYRLKCEEKKAQLESERESLIRMLGRLEGAMDMACECTLDEAREAIYSDSDNVVTDEDAAEDIADATEESDDDLNVVDEDEPVAEDEESSKEEDELPDAASPEVNDEWGGFHDSPEADLDNDDDDIPQPEDEDEFSNVDMESFSPDGTLNFLFN